MSATQQRKAACSSCPWVKNNDRTVCFDPKDLERTVVDAMQRGNIHPCHSENDYMCSGYLAFAEKNLKGGANSLQMTRIAARLHMFNFKLINIDLDVFSSIKSMLSDHKKRRKNKNV